MKKSLIVIALALLMIVPVFAATVTAGSAAKAGDKLTAAGPQETEVNVSLDLTPKYAFGVTGGNSTDTTTYVKKFTEQNIVANKPADESVTNYVLYDKVNRVESISMIANLTNMKLEGPDSANTYYISYWFFENNTDNVKLTAKIDHDLTLKDDDIAKVKNNTAITYDEANAKIPFQVTIDGVTTVLNSTTGNTETVKTATVQSQIGKIEKGDVKITVAPTTVDTLENKYTGTYIAHIVLNLTVGA